jgi:hypothetical protein
VAAASKWSPKDPTDVADYWIDWTPILNQQVGGTTVAANVTAVVVTVPAGLTKVGTEDFTGNITRARFGGGAIGKYDTNWVITTDTGETFELTKVLEVKERIKT